MDMQKYLDLFVSEANEHIQAAGNEVARLASGLTPPETINALFRHFHSIKGMAASMGFEEIASLSHAVEDLFDRLRKGSAAPATLTDLVMEALDSTSAMVAWASRGDQRGAITIDTRSVIEKIRALMPPPPAVRASQNGTGPRHAGPAGRVEPPVEQRPRTYQCLIAIDPRAEFPGARAALALKRLEQIGRIVDTTPERASLQRPDFSGEIVVDLTTERPQAALLAAMKDLLDVKRFEVQEAPDPTAQVPGPEAPETGHATVRIPTSTLDCFLDSISEMITRRGALASAIKSNDVHGAREALGKLSESIQDLRKQVMLIRLMPFDHITPRLTRTVRELCRKTGKRVSLQITGSDVSLDRSVLEEVIDPLSHILRNAVDHGIELPAQRELVGKPAQGSIRIDVTREGDSVLVSVDDDGKGMDKEAIKRTAMAGGFASETELAAMDEQQIFLLTTIPGFSTAARVTDVSGRGVGMDVVHTRVEALHGHMRISSQRGRGTRLELTLPLTVAVIDAFLVECRAGVFAVPASSVAGVELVDPGRIRTTLAGCFLAPRGEAEVSSTAFIPLVRLDDAFGAPPGTLDPSGAVSLPIQVLAYQASGARGAIAVDRIRDRREVVVKPLGPPLERLRKYSGAALLDDGSVALILDLVNLARA